MLGCLKKKKIRMELLFITQNTPGRSVIPKFNPFHPAGKETFKECSFPSPAL